MLRFYFRKLQRRRDCGFAVFIQEKQKSPPSLAERAFLKFNTPGINNSRLIDANYPSGCAPPCGACSKCFAFSDSLISSAHPSGAPAERPKCAAFCRTQPGEVRNCSLRIVENKKAHRVVGFFVFIWRRARDSNPRYHYSTSVFKTDAFNRSASSPKAADYTGLFLRHKNKNRKILGHVSAQETTGKTDGKSHRRLVSRNSRARKAIALQSITLYSEWKKPLQKIPNGKYGK